MRKKIKLFFVTKTETRGMYSFFLFFKVDLNEEKRVYNMQDENKIMLCTKSK